MRWNCTPGLRETCYDALSVITQSRFGWKEEIHLLKVRFGIPITSVWDDSLCGSNKEPCDKLLVYNLYYLIAFLWTTRYIRHVGTKPLACHILHMVLEAETYRRDGFRILQFFKLANACKFAIICIVVTRFRCWAVYLVQNIYLYSPLFSRIAD